MKYKLRDYQQKASDAAVAAFANKRNGLIVAPTGSGKSLIIADIAYRLGTPLLVFQPNKEILEQNFAKLKSYGVEDCSIYSASMKSKKISRITFATIGSVMNHKEDFDVFRNVIIDEAHCVNSKEGQYQEFILLRNRTVIGLTATPYRLSQAFGRCSILKFLTRTRPRIFDKVLYYIQISDLLSKGYLANIKYYDLTEIDLRNVRSNSTGSDYDEESLIREYERTGFYDKLFHTTMRVLHPKSGVPRKGILVFTRFTKEADVLTQKLRGMGVNAAIVTGETPKRERERILEGFKSGEISVVGNVGVLTCLSSDTEILTRNGWKNADTLCQTDLVAQYDKGNITFHEPLRIIRNQHAGDFVTVEGRYMNIRITDDQTVIYRKMARTGLGDERRAFARDIVGQSVYIPISGECAPEKIFVEQPKMNCSKRRFINYNAYNYRKKGFPPIHRRKHGSRTIEWKSSMKYKDPHELTEAECTFIGFWLGDGCYSHGRYSVTQSLGTPKMCSWLEKLLSQIGIHYTVQVYRGGVSIVAGRECYVHGHKVFNLAKGTGGDKQKVDTALTKILPYLKKGGTDLYWGMSKKQLLSLCYGLFMANGWHGDLRKSSSIRFCSADAPLLDLLQGICACRGLCMQISQIKRDIYKVPFFNVSVREASYHQLVNEKLALERNNKPEPVWCVTMPEGTIVTRRGGRVAILGNCGFDYPELDTVILARPTKSLALYYQMVGREIRPFPNKDAWCIDLGGSYRRFGRVSDLKIGVEKEGTERWAVFSRGYQLTNVSY